MNKILSLLKRNLFFTAVTFMIVSTVVFLIANPFKTKEISVSIFSSCSIDNIQGASNSNGTFLTTAGNRLIVQGWVGDSIKSTKSDNLFFEIADSKNNIISSKVSKSDFARPDVANAYKNRALEYTGFNVDLGLIDTPGEYTILLGSINDSQHQICTIPFKLKVS